MQLRLLITGSQGFIGKPLTQKLRKQGATVIEWEEDVRDICSCSETVEVVLHLAAKVRYDQFETNSSLSWDVNVVGTEAVLQYCQRVNAQLIFASTSGVYQSSKEGKPLMEEDLIAPQSPYPLSKWVAEKLCELAYKNSGVPVTVLRVFNPYGPYQHPSFLIPQALQCLLEAKPLALRMPQAIRDFVYVDDAVRVFFLAAQKKQEGFHVINVASGVGVTIRETVEKLARLLNRPLKIENSNAHSGELVCAIGNNQKAKQQLNWAPQFDLETGLKQMLKQIFSR